MATVAEVRAHLDDYGDHLEVVIMDANGRVHSIGAMHDQPVEGTPAVVLEAS